MITSRMRRRRRLLDTFVRVELEKRRSATARHPWDPRKVPPSGSPEALREREELGGAAVVEPIAREARDAAG